MRVPNASNPAVRPRAGTVLPMVAVTLVVLLGVLALAIDLGLVAVAKAQCQNAADAAAMAGARSLNGSRASGASSGSPITSADNNYDAAAVQAASVAAMHKVMTKSIDPAQVSVTVGKYIYDRSSSKFVAYPIDTGVADDSSYNWSLVRAKITSSGPSQFSKIFGATGFQTSATAVAVHRPRDVALVLDFSGSMRFGSLPGIPIGSSRQSNNPEQVFPKFGPYSAVSTAALQQTEATETISGSTYQASNITASDPLNSNRLPITGDFRQGPGTAASLGFSSAGNGNADGIVSGDDHLKIQKNSGTTYAKTVKELLSIGSWNGKADPSFEKSSTNTYATCGYDLADFDSGTTYPTFSGYTQGPSYWGKTFFIWPPDPRGVGRRTGTGDERDNGANDWRKRFFLESDGVTPVDDNALLWINDTESSSNKGRWRSPRYSSTTYYKINYRAILHWLYNSGPNPFPSQLRAGRISYYDELPSAADTTLNTRFWNFNPASPSGLTNSERFWKEYIDYVLGLVQTGSNTWDAESSTSRPTLVRLMGYGDDFTWGTLKITAQSALTGSPKPYMHYDDNPMRPKTHFWFGPLTLVDFLGNYNLANRYSAKRFDWLPGTAREAPLYACKLGIAAALADIELNHPNDAVSLIFYGSPKSSSSDSDGRFNRPRVPLGRLYSRMADSLWFPPKTLDSYSSSSPVSMYDSDNAEVPRAGGATCYSMGLMLAYNQFSGNPTLRTFNPGGLNGDAGGLGRRGARKLIIFETDGQPNQLATPSGGSSGFTRSVAANGENQSYYNIRFNSSTPSSSQFPSVNSDSDNSSSVRSQIYDIANRICAKETDSNPGFATTRKPVKIHCIAFGPLFDTSSSARTEGLRTLQQLEVIGGTQTAATGTPSLASYKIVTGTDDEVITKLKQAIGEAMQDGIQVSLIR